MASVEKGIAFLTLTFRKKSDLYFFTFAQGFDLQF